MKTKEEIDNLAESKFNEKYYPISKKGYIEGYTRCQLDMADKLKEVYEQGLKNGYACMPSINSLNKQD